MKKGSCACLLAIAIFLGSCVNEKNKPNSISVNPKEEISQNSITETDNTDNTNKYTFEFYNDTYYDMNDLTYFLADTSVKSLRFYGGTFSDLSPLAELRDLEELSLEANRYITDISPIGSLVNLKKLTLLNYSEEKSIEPLSSLVNLKSLELWYNDEFYKELLPLQQLEILKLGNSIPQGVDVNYIAQLRTLKELAIQAPPYPYSESNIINIDRLKNLVNLEKLSISYLGGINFSWITSLQKLKELRLFYCTVDDVSPLLKLPNLIEVNLPYTKVRDITPLLESKSIKEIHGPIVENDIGFYHLFRERGIEYYPHTSDR
jgi:hypothetical protein